MKILNKKAFYNYELRDKIEAGISLIGIEVKSIREKHVDLSSSYVKIINNIPYLINAKIYPYSFSRSQDYQENRSRQLLLKKKEIISLKSKIEGKGLTIVPVSLYTKGPLIKVGLAVAKSKKEYQKKQSLKEKDIQREQEIELGMI